MKVLAIKRQLEILADTDPATTAENAGLIYVTDEDLLFYRRKQGKSFAYLNEDGKKIKDKHVILRIKSLVIPPAWEDVKICCNRSGHIQATGRDQKGRKQYIYHPEWEVLRNQTKFYRMIKFGESLPLIRKHVKKDLNKKGMVRDKVLALIVRLLEETLIRIGNKEYAQKNDSYGLTTLLDKHFKTKNGISKLLFKGKSNRLWEVDIKNKRIAKLIRQCQDIPGQQLFQYYDENGTRQPVTSTDVNNYLQNITGEDFTAKEFRTWGGSVLAMTELCQAELFENEDIAEKNIKMVIKQIAQALTNTVSICKKYYIHPEILNSYINGTIKVNLRKTSNKSPYALALEEQAFLNLLKQKIKEEPLVSLKKIV